MAMKEADEDDILDDDDTDDKLESVSFKNILLLAYIFQTYANFIHYMHFFTLFTEGKTFYPYQKTQDCAQHKGKLYCHVEYCKQRPLRKDLSNLTNLFVHLRPNCPGLGIKFMRTGRIPITRQYPSMMKR